MINAYCERLSEILKNIEKELDDLTSESFSKELCKFGYKPKELSSVDSIEGIIDDLNEITNFTGVYIFEETSENLLIQEVWNNFKVCMGDNKVPKWKQDIDSKNNIFYVGKSNRIGQRIKEHIINASKSTYALKLHCFEEKCQLKLKYKIHIFYLETESDNKRNAVNELVESILHDRLTPNIGSKKINNL